MAKIIMTSSFRGGSGKSTVVSNLTYYAASKGLRVLVIDTDIISPSIHLMLGVDQSDLSTTLTDYLTDHAKILDCVYDISHNFGFKDDLIHFVPSSINHGDIVELLQERRRGEKLVQAIETLDYEFEPDIIILDTHPGLNEEFIVAGEHSEVILNIVRPDNQDYQGLIVSKKVADKMGVPFYTILNKVHSKIDISKVKKYIKSEIDSEVLGSLPFFDEILLSQNKIIMIERKPNSSFSKEIKIIGKKIFGL